MIVYPNSKINLGLNVLNKRPDGYHTIETALYPVSWCDALEVLEHDDQNNPFIFSQSGLSIAGDPRDNLIFKAWEMIASEKKLPPVKVHLHKNIPMGAGLGGGSSDAAHFIELLDQKFVLEYEKIEKRAIASKLGADCAFFMKNKAVIAKGVGNKFSNLEIDLSDYYILLVYPDIHSNTRTAYEGLKLRKDHHSLHSLLEKHDLYEWRGLIHNDFEDSIFLKYPSIGELKSTLYSNDAIYASLSGSGSSVFGIFEDEPKITFNPRYQVYLQKPVVNVL